MRGPWHSSSTCGTEDTLGREAMAHPGKPQVRREAKASALKGLGG